ncbi:hypothetical protein [Phaeobacter gallaeciensis]|uniref:hypothetical protein n=1 Tax=Phaeobacter gallaeciensis TaxID=60890 RepID=UPI00237F95EF|nr:hypothetical protein [Phaeobacter gallaeciensis]MDE4063177.1 hypothetical protein [Phaeobacter gallaeciensis]MDE4126185.1 hypothetical protein [Phaeobacter gallaeciensis]MDE4130651.1 hypothetical protein [Phaeobacter gallaeciensis]
MKNTRYCVIVSRQDMVDTIQMNGCDLPATQAFKLDEIITGITDWSDGRATSTVMEHGVHGRYVETDETPDVLIDLPAEEVVERARTEMPRQFPDLIERRPFNGLVSSNPTKAIVALDVAAQKGDYPVFLWSSLIDKLPDDVTPEVYRAFLEKLTGLPCAVIGRCCATPACGVTVPFPLVVMPRG